MRVHGGRAKETGFKGRDFSSNLNPFAPHEALKETLLSCEEVFFNHPPAYPYHHEALLAQALDLHQENVCLLPGSVYGIHLILSCIKPSNAVVPVPTFNEYERICGCLGIEVERHILREENAFKLCLGEVVSKIDHGSVVFVCNPNNPTGYFFGVDEMAGLVRWCEREGAFVVFDEAFIDFTDKGKDTVQQVVDSKNAVILRSFTKVFSIPGVRLGYALGHPEVIEKLRELVPSWSITWPALQALEVICRDMELIEKWRKRLSELRGTLVSGLKGIGLLPFPSAANFLLVKVEGVSSESIYKALLEKGIMVRVFPEYPMLDCFFRVCVRKEKDNEELLDALREIL